jgi:BMFP domain-containing protein YqiC
LSYLNKTTIFEASRTVLECKKTALRTFGAHFLRTHEENSRKLKLLMKKRGKRVAMDQKFLDDLSRRLTKALPGGVKELQHDVEKNLRAILQSAFSKMDLVTREEYEVQAQVLARTRAKIEALEKLVGELEKKLL